MLSSKLYVIDLKRQSEEAKAVITFSGALPVALDYKKNGQIHLVTDVGVGIVSKDFSSQRTAAYANGLYQYHFTNDRTYVLTTDTNSVSCSILMTDGEAEKVATLKGEVLDVSDNGKTSSCWAKASSRCSTGSFGHRDPQRCPTTSTASRPSAGASTF